MKSSLLKFVLYALPDAVAKAMPFLILPITTRHLSLHDFGLIALFNLCIVPFNVLSEFGTGYIVNSLWFKYGREERRELLSVLLALRLTLLLAATAIIAPLAGDIFPHLIGKDWPSLEPLFPWFLGFVLTGFVTPIYSAWVVMEGRAKQFAAIGTFQIILGSLVTLFTSLTGRYQNVIIGGVIVGALVAAVRFTLLLPHLSARLSSAHLPVIFRMGWPIFLRSGFNQLRTRFDKLYLASSFGGAQFALYNWAGGVYRLYPTAESHLSKVCEPQFLKQLSAGKVDTGYFSRIFFSWFFLSLAGSVLFFFIGQPAIRLLTNGVFEAAYEPLLLLTCLALNGALLFGQPIPIVHAGKTQILLLVTICSAVFGVGSGLLLIPSLGANGAALSLWIAQAVTAPLYLVFRRRFFSPWLAEPLIAPYLIAYWTLVLLYVFLDVPIGIPLLCLLAAAAWHLHRRRGFEALRGVFTARRRRDGPPKAADPVAAGQEAGSGG